MIPWLERGSFQGIYPFCGLGQHLRILAGKDPSAIFLEHCRQERYLPNTVKILISIFARMVVKESGSSRGWASGSVKSSDSERLQFCSVVSKANLSDLCSFITLML